MAARTTVNWNRILKHLKIESIGSLDTRPLYAMAVLPEEQAQHLHLLDRRDQLIPSLAGVFLKVDQALLGAAFNLGQLGFAEREMFQRMERVVELLHIACAGQRRSMPMSHACREEPRRSPSEPAIVRAPSQFRSEHVPVSSSLRSGTLAQTIGYPWRARLRASRSRPRSFARVRAKSAAEISQLSHIPV